MYIFLSLDMQNCLKKVKISIPCILSTDFMPKFEIKIFSFSHYSQLLLHQTLAPNLYMYLSYSCFCVYYLAVVAIVIQIHSRNKSVVDVLPMIAL